MNKGAIRNALLAAASVGLCSALPAEAQLSGAIFTTNADGSIVNGNIYADICDVYLDGGPGPNAPATAAGLPDGDYYFQVTDPSGQVLLSTDPVENRQLRVEGGIIIGLSGAGNHATGVDIDNGAVTVQLCPFDETPNPGGVYKAWVTPVAAFVGDPGTVDNGYSPGFFHGFIPADSKTDNFKVRRRGDKPPCLMVIKFEDDDEDGQWDNKGRQREPQWAWPVTAIGPDGSEVNGTRYTPFTLCNLPTGEYTITEAELDAPDSIWPWRVTANIVDGVSITPASRTIVITISDSDREVVFGNNH